MTLWPMTFPGFGSGKKFFQFERIYLDERARQDEIARLLLDRLPHVPVEVVSEKKPLIKEALLFADPLGEGKRRLFLTRFYGRRIKPCPGTSNHICCGYKVINVVTNCPMDCSYCVLQVYLNNPFLTVYVNWDDLFTEIKTFLERSPGSILRFGTGELSDSLALEPILPMSERLVPFFAGQGKAILELKTKSAEVDHLLGLDHRGKTIVSWSLNPATVIATEEKKTASLEERIEAASRCQQAGYPLGFHFDPLIHYEGWEKGYQETIGRLFRSIDPGRVIWVSLGGFRYPPDLKGIVKERFPGTRIFLGEMFPGRDRKFRYLREIRVEMYRKVLGWLKEVDPKLFVYLCMESQEVWRDVFGWTPSSSGHLNELFEERLRTFDRS